jgi:hypothetical protein
MLGYVAGVQRKEIREGIACVKHQNMSGSDIGDDHKEYFAGEAALKAGGVHNTMNQFSEAASLGPEMKTGPEHALRAGSLIPSSSGLSRGPMIPQARRR